MTPEARQVLVERAQDWFALDRVRYGGDGVAADLIRDLLASLAEPAPSWQPIETASTGSWPSGPEDTRDPAYVAPPRVWLLLEDERRCVGYFDAYYAEGGRGYDGDPPWVEEFSGERVRPMRWMPLPAAPVLPAPFVADGSRNQNPASTNRAETAQVPTASNPAPVLPAPERQP